jgi:predicted AAA+ superfamily ATPase
MKRLIDWHLLQWKDYRFRKPLLVRGARQVGKTYAIRKFGHHFENFVEINFEKITDAKYAFDKGLAPEKIIQGLIALTGKNIIPGKTLLFFDEVQECPAAIQALRYFHEEMPSQHVIAAGSLLDFTLEQIGIPVGRVSSFYIFPVSFIEFLVAIGQPLLAKAVLEQPIGVPMLEVIHRQLLDYVGQYFAIGGMPETVANWVSSKNPIDSFLVLQGLIDTYRQDFDKYAKKHQVKYLSALFDQIPRFIGNQFKYSEVHGEYKKRELAPCLGLLCKAGVVHKIHHSAGNGLPLSGEINLEWFKLISLDVALNQAILGSDLSPWFLNPKDAFSNQGSLVESFIGQELLCYSMPQRHTDLYFWKREQRTSRAKVDYLYDYKGQIIPIEAKSSQGSTLKSMRLFLEEHPKSPYGIRFSTHNYSILDKIDSRPHYAVVSLAHEEQKQALQFLVD